MRQIEPTDANILKSRELAKRLGGISYEKLREMAQSNPSEIRDIALNYSDLLGMDIDGESIDSDRAYHLVDDLRMQVPKIFEKKTNAEKSVWTKILLLKSTDASRIDASIVEIKNMIQDSRIADDSPIYDIFNRMLKEVKGYVAPKSDNVPKRSNNLQYRPIMQRAIEKKGCWPELADYVFKRLESNCVLEGKLDVGFPVQNGNEYQTRVTYSLGKNFEEIIAEPSSVENSAENIRMVRKNAIDTSKKNLEGVLGTSVFYVNSGSDVQITVMDH